MTDKVLILDFGSQVTQLIARRVREGGVYCEIHPFNKVTAESIADFDPKAIILSGGPASVTQIDTPRAPQAVFDTGLPLLGICYGEQTICAQLGGAVTPLAAPSLTSSMTVRCSRMSGALADANRSG